MRKELTDVVARTVKAGAEDKTVLKNAQVVRPIYDLRRDEVELLATVPYDDPGSFFDVQRSKIARRMCRGEFLEVDPTSSKYRPRYRCTERGAEAVTYFKRRGWLTKP